MIEAAPLPLPPRTGRDETSDYLVDMIAELARLARSAGQPDTAILLEAIIAARRAIETDRSA